MHYIKTEFLMTQFPAADIAKCLDFIMKLRDMGVEYEHYFVD